jgi:Flp pilus assembly protein TadG
MRARNPLRDDAGAVLVEVTIMMSIMLIFLLGAIEFLFVFYQLNAAAKAVQIGARIAAVSDPVAAGLDSYSTVVVGTAIPGAAMPGFEVTCDGAASRCTCTRGPACPRDLSYDQTAMNTIVYGRGSSSCTDATNFYNTGMCDVFSRISTANVLITYTQSGLGFAGRPGRPVPTITVALQGLSLQLLFIGGILRLDKMQMPPLTTPITAEDLSSSAPIF